jgi:hypothetical protein
MSRRSKAFASYMNDIYSQYDLLLERLADDRSITLATEERTNFAVLGSMPEGDIEALAFLVLMQAAKSAQEDLKAIMEEVRAINQVKQRQREALAKLKRQVADIAENDDDKIAPANPCGGLDVDLLTQLITVVAARQSDQELIAAADQYSLARERFQRAELIGALKDELDTLSEISEMEQLRLQMIMDRRSKMIEMLSNLLKKMSETQDAITENLK